MGSLLKEYITLPEEISETAAGDNDVSSTKEGDDIKDEEMQNTNPEKENGQSHNSATVEQNNKENVSGRQFKKVVAIVDPPRGGLHPTVSTLFYILSIQTIQTCVSRSLQSPVL